MPGKRSRNEVSYYPEIQTFIEAQLKSNFRAKRHKELSVFWGIGELKTNLQRIISEHPDKCTCVKNFANRVPPLNLDIFALITDGTQFEILILEVKLMNEIRTGHVMLLTRERWLEMGYSVTICSK